MPAEIDLLRIDRGSVMAPAGCGKTQVIADNLVAYAGKKRILILTHTNAGAAALRLRLQRAGVLASTYQVATLDGFCMKLISHFPTRSGHDPHILDLARPAHDYPAIRDAATALLDAGHIRIPLCATYSRLFVDEYQDCSVVQHSMVKALSGDLPTIVLGDPMQAIFGFRGNVLVDWQQDVEPHFPAIGQLSTPWRWRNAGTTRLGIWLIDVRAQLARRAAVDLRQAPPEVQWIPLQAKTADDQRRIAAQTATAAGEQTVVIIGDARNVQGRHLLSSQTPGATSVERVDMEDLVRFANRFDFGAGDACEQVVKFAADCMTQVGPTNLMTRVVSIRAGRVRNPPTTAEAAAIAFIERPSATSTLALLDALEGQHRCRVFRPDMLRCLKQALQAIERDAGTLHEAVLSARERNRYSGRPISRRAVGSTLLLKGLEADVAVITHVDGMSAPNLYVALTRGAKRVVVCSESPVVVPAL